MLAALWALACGLLLPLRSAAAATRQLKRLVLVGRHSVKNPYPPTGSPLQAGVANSPLAAYTGRSLPTFSVEPGQLTPHGRELMGQLGAFFREQYADLLKGAPCERLAVYADPASERDVHSAEAFLGTLSGPSGCPSASVNSGASAQRLKRIFRDQPDAFDLSRGCVPPTIEELGALLGVSGAVGGRGVEASWLRVYKRQLSQVQEITQCCWQDACAAGAGGLCTIFSLPLALQPNVTWRAVGGPLGAASALAEIFQMQFCEGLDAGWGLAEEDMVELLSLLDVPFNDAGANEVTSRNLGSELLAELVSALAPHGGAAGAGAAPVLAAYFGHDTNLQFLRRMLKLSWFSEGWWPNLAEPGSMLAFELYSEAGGAESVRLLKVAATPKQQRHATPLSPEAPPSVVPLWIPGCDGVFCPLPQLLSLARAALREDCVEAPGRAAAAGAHMEDSTALRGMQAAMGGAAGLVGEPVGTIHAESSSAGFGGWQGAGALPAWPERARGEVKPEAAGDAARGGPEAADAGRPPAAGEAAADSPVSAAAKPPAAEEVPAEPQPQPAQSGGGGGGFPFMLLLAVAGFFAWRHMRKQQAASRGYETLGGSRSRPTASDRVIGARGGTPGFTL